MDGGKSFSQVSSAAHGDFHDVWIDPENTNLLFAAVPAAIWTLPHPFSIWTTVCGSAAAAGLLAAAALAPPMKLHDYEKAARTAIILIAIGLVVMGTIVGLYVDRLPVGLDPARNPTAVGMFAGALGTLPFFGGALLQFTGSRFELSSWLTLRVVFLAHASG